MRDSCTDSIGKGDIMSFIEGKDLTYEYFRRDEEGNVESIDTALRSVNFSVEAGQFVAILGPNGSGKSTLAKHLNALLTPASGTLYVDGKDTSKVENELDIRQTAGMIFQNPDNQIVAGVVDEDVGFGPENIGIPTEEILERVERALRNVDMWKYRDKSPNKLSGGQKQRVAIAGVLAMEPKCIIFDESTAMLDPEGRAEIVRVAHALNQRKHITVLWITHYMEEVVGADRVLVMDKGELVMQGTPREIFSDVEGLLAHGLTVPPITLLAERLRSMGYPLPAGILTKKELADAICRLGGAS